MSTGIEGAGANKAAEEAIQKATEQTTKEANTEDVAQFQSAMQSGGSESGTAFASGPQGVQSATPGDAILQNMGLQPVAPHQETMTPSQKLMESLQSFGEDFKSTRESIKTRLDNFDKNPDKITSADLIGLQSDLHQVGITLDVFSKGTDKVSRMIQTLIRGQ